MDYMAAQMDSQIEGAISENERLSNVNAELLDALKSLHDRLSQSMQLGLSAHEAYDSFYQEMVGSLIAQSTPTVGKEG